MADADIGLLFFAGTILAIVLACVMLGVRYGSLRGAMFGARVARELGAIESTGGMFSRSLTARVYELEGEGSTRVGLEIRFYGKRSYATLDASAARKLAALLEAGARRG